MTAPQGPGWPGQPGQQAPYPPRPPGQPYPQQQPYPYPPQYPPPPPPKGRRGRTALIVSLVVVLVAGVGIGGWALFGGGSGAVNPDAPQAGGTTEAKGLTEADVATVDPKKLLDDMFLAFLTQPVQHTRMDKIWFGQVTPYLAGQEYRGDVIEGAYDYQQRKMNYLDRNVVCVNGTKRQLNRDGTTSDFGSCASVDGLSWQSKVGNGLIPSGLTRDQAQAFLDYLHVPEGFLSPGKPTWVDRDGKQHVRLPVVFRSVQTSMGRAGTQNFIWAFQKTKIPFEQHAFTTAGASPDQVEGVFYLDPKTLLPAYSELLIYNPQSDPTGGKGQVRRVEYLWDGQLPEPDPNRPGTAAGPSWPAERLKPGQVN
ncbi:hypothetical protein [Allokutzneria oryzae]|uniref:Uncharacterized protein n=1 Tax=Allokutzneria oryzae TaxID=1378989 RepID=A0ABV5ZWZ6_9PSEU